MTEGHFTAGGERYAQFRPHYPAALAQALAALAPAKRIAVDIGCGSGQLTTLLAPHFERVIGVDPSESQLASAHQHAGVSYHCAPAENTGLPEHSADLITVAQAAHWFDLPAFCNEVRRIASPGAALALISYGVPYIEDPINAIFQKGYWQDVYRFWSPERRHVETGYADLNLPFNPLAAPDHDCRASLSLAGLIGYITTWSAYATAQKAGDTTAFEQFFESLSRAWGDAGEKTVVWPVSVKAARIG
ncbi:class I SAM-dependent methyltransferase [Parahalioglobus pacificus]|uniref:Methyltransferase type 11 domain-containing protein n=1 Tax=Parahalioglobus pacificus TaxID=930806 RepID=A0A918XDW1_9GAMM|nr:class I SAM-dependent methyltransferase [Halioglobus pacificus]GHD27709.1 hypothetical protein GCM10007053_06350 [Halioglobus pacificus]